MSMQSLSASPALGPAIGRGIVTFLTIILAWQAIRSCAVFPPGHPGFLYLLWSAGIILPFHEAGHFISSPFGYAFEIFGGSFWQVGFPLLLFIVALRQKSFWWTIYLTLAGIHLVDVTPYIFDAPFRSLPLITGNKHSHDWGNLLNHFQAQHHAERLANLAFYGGMLVTVVGIGCAVYVIISEYREAATPRVKLPLTQRVPRRRKA